MQEFAKKVEDSLTSTYRKKIYTPFLKAIHEFELIEDNDKIAIAISGGKDSLLLAKLFQELKKDKSKNFEFKAISLNPGFTPENLEQFKENLKMLNIDCKIIDTEISYLRIVATFCSNSGILPILANSSSIKRKWIGRRCPSFDWLALGLTPPCFNKSKAL